VSGTLSQRQKLALWLVAVVFLTAACAVALTRIPWCDEAWFACAGFNLATHGKLITPVIAAAPDDPKTIGLGQHTYWVMPLHLLLQAGWYRLFGFSLFALRSISILWGLVALGSWLVIMRELAGDLHAAVLTVVLLGTDYVFVLRAADGRMDMMSAALGYAAVAAYLALRHRSLDLAILCAHTLVVLSGLTHPNGGLLSLAGVLFLMFHYDRASIGVRRVALLALPYLAGAAGWGLYIAEDPRLFLTQFSGNAASRLSTFEAPWRALRREITERYLTSFGFQAGAPAAAKVKLLLLLGYVTGLVGTLSAAELRRNRGVRVLLVLAAIPLLFLTLFDSTKHPAYLVYVIPFFSAVLAVWILWCRNNLPSAVVTLAVAAFICLQLGAIANVVKQNKYRRSYGEAVAFLKARAGKADLIMGEPELGFALGFNSELVDDRRLGYYSHRKPRFIVAGEDYRQTFQNFRRQRPEIARYVATLLDSQYQRVFANDDYTIFARQ
jgi:4-amino-4-deoxy-L-arabinose transferase-like glycosyltransferase